VQRLLRPAMMKDRSRTKQDLLRELHSLRKRVAILERDENLAGSCALSCEVTDRRQGAEVIREPEPLFREYIENAPDGVYMNDLEGRFLFGNRKCEDIIGYRRDELIGKNFLELNILTEDSLYKAARLLQANAEGKSTGPDEIDLIHKDGRIIPIEISTAVVSCEDQRIVLAFVRDITAHRKAEIKFEGTLATLRKALNTTIQVMVSAVEIRDPYTANHQIRCADLARAIATEMGLAGERIDAIRMAGAIHDIGKLATPAEILSKPTRLTEVEFRLIKEHAQQGYELLKDAESIWPLAEIVHQHHERIDGSGYPRNLKQDEILLESRILAVADTVEAMASHRPYRPALGIAAALQEIEDRRGILFDIAVADACLTLFREKHYKFKETGSETESAPSSEQENCGSTN
jgi:PAS domain S-box-containing protein/putative nucleotidyltransferase with HDIG domain